MKTILKISVLLNVVLLGGVLFLWRQPRTVKVAVPLPAKVEPQTAPVVETVVAPFRWSELRSNNDYLAFVANLRAAGCPEPTVEDIVRGNTGRAYAMMRARLGVDQMQPGPWSGQAQEQMVAYFLGRSSSADVAAMSAGQGNPAAGNGQTTSPVAAFLQNVDLVTAGMSAEQAQETTNLVQAYLAQLDQAQTNQVNSKRPAWLRRSPAALQAAQAEGMLSGLFGAGVAARYEQYLAGQGGQQ